MACPVFGLAHGHHLINHCQNEGRSISQALLIVTIQISYTSLFAFYTGWVFVHTGHILGPILVHMFCNHMQLPDFTGYLNPTHVLYNSRKSIMILYIAGILGFSFMFQLFQPAYFGSVYFLSS